MYLILILIQAPILLLLSALHVSWVFGGTWGFDKALPTNEEGKKVLSPSKFDSAMVAVGLLLFAGYYLLKGNIIYIGIPSYMLKYAGWTIAGIFLLRAIGDFNYIGFFKRVKSTEFAKLDTLIYAPLCLVLAILGITIELLF